MYRTVTPAKKLSGEMKRDDAAATIMISPTTSDDAFGHKKDVICAVPLADNHRIAAVTDRPSPKGKNAAFYSLLTAIAQERW